MVGQLSPDPSQSAPVHCVFAVTRRGNRQRRGSCALTMPARSGISARMNKHRHIGFNGWMTHRVWGIGRGRRLV